MNDAIGHRINSVRRRRRAAAARWGKMSRMGEQRYEYVAVQLGLFSDEAKMTERINSVAEHGWRLVEVANGPKGGADKLIFERPVL